MNLIEQNYLLSFTTFIYMNISTLIMIGQQASSSRYLIKPLTQEHQEAGIKLAKQTFLQEPLRVGFFKKFPEKKEEEDDYWRVAMKIFQQQFFNYGWSFGCFDLENNRELVGILLAADTNNKVSEEIVKQMTTAISGEIMKASKQLIQGMNPKYMEILNSEQARIINLEIIGVKNGHRGKHLVTKMVIAYELEAIAKGFEHSICWASNAKTSAVLQKMGYEIASELNIHEIKDGEEKVLSFSEVEEENKFNQFWIKKFDKGEQTSKK